MDSLKRCGFCQKIGLPQKSDVQKDNVSSGMNSTPTEKNYTDDEGTSTEENYTEEDSTEGNYLFEDDEENQSSQAEGHETTFTKPSPYLVVGLSLIGQTAATLTILYNQNDCDYQDFEIFQVEDQLNWDSNGSGMFQRLYERRCGVGAPQRTPQQTKQQEEFKEQFNSLQEYKDQIEVQQEKYQQDNPTADNNSNLFVERLTTLERHKQLLLDEDIEIRKRYVTFIEANLKSNLRQNLLRKKIKEGSDLHGVQLTDCELDNEKQQNEKALRKTWDAFELWIQEYKSKSEELQKLDKKVWKECTSSVGLTMEEKLEQLKDKLSIIAKQQELTRDLGEIVQQPSFSHDFSDKCQAAMAQEPFDKKCARLGYLINICRGLKDSHECFAELDAERQDRYKLSYDHLEQQSADLEDYIKFVKSRKLLEPKFSKLLKAYDLSVSQAFGNISEQACYEQCGVKPTRCQELKKRQTNLNRMLKQMNKLKTCCKGMYRVLFDGETEQGKEYQKLKTDAYTKLTRDLNPMEGVEHLEKLVQRQLKKRATFHNMLRQGLVKECYVNKSWVENPGNILKASFDDELETEKNRQKTIQDFINLSPSLKQYAYWFFPQAPDNGKSKIKGNGKELLRELQDQKIICDLIQKYFETYKQDKPDKNFAFTDEPKLISLLWGKYFNKGKSLPCYVKDLSPLHMHSMAKEDFMIKHKERMKICFFNKVNNSSDAQPYPVRLNVDRIQEILKHHVNAHGYLRKIHVEQLENYLQRQDVQDLPLLDIRACGQLQTSSQPQHMVIRKQLQTTKTIANGEQQYRQLQRYYNTDNNNYIVCRQYKDGKQEIYEEKSFYGAVEQCVYTTFSLNKGSEYEPKNKCFDVKGLIALDFLTWTEKLENALQFDVMQQLQC